jgi:hypothetical protein
LILLTTVLEEHPYLAVKRHPAISMCNPGKLATKTSFYFCTVINQICEQEEISAKELRMGSRRGHICQVRSQIAYQLVEDYGLPLAEVARHLGVSTSAISKAITKKMRE